LVPGKFKNSGFRPKTGQSFLMKLNADLQNLDTLNTLGRPHLGGIPSLVGSRPGRGHGTLLNQLTFGRPFPITNSVCCNARERRK
jgi:hypothetical protein